MRAKLAFYWDYDVFYTRLPPLNTNRPTCTKRANLSCATQLFPNQLPETAF